LLDQPGVILGFIRYVDRRPVIDSAPESADPGCSREGGGPDIYQKIDCSSRVGGNLRHSRRPGVGVGKVAVMAGAEVESGAEVGDFK